MADDVIDPLLSTKCAHSKFGRRCDPGFYLDIEEVRPAISRRYAHSLVEGTQKTSSPSVHLPLYCSGVGSVLLSFRETSSFFVLGTKKNENATKESFGKNKIASIESELNGK